MLSFGVELGNFHLQIQNLSLQLGVFTVDSNGHLRDSLKNSLRNAMLALVHQLFNTGLKLSQTIFLV
jgi:hypothetical protein